MSRRNMITAMQEYLKWDAAENKPRIISGKGTSGEMYCVSVPGSALIDGCATWELNDFILYWDNAWKRIPFLTMMRERFILHAKKQNWTDSDLQFITDTNHKRFGKFQSLIIQEYWEYYQAGFKTVLEE